MFILPKRCAEVAFSEPMLRTIEGLLVKVGNPKNLHSYEDVAKHADAIIAIVAGGAEHDFARKAGVPEDRILVLQDAGALLAAVKSGRADSASATPPTVKSMAEKGGGDVEVADPFHTPAFAISYTGSAIRKEDVEFREAFNRALKQYVGTQEFLDLFAPLDMTRDNLPGDMTTAEQCAREG